MSQSTARVGALLFWAGCLAGPLCAEEWPQWRGPNRTGHVFEGARVPTALPKEAKVVWQMEIGEGLASPVVAGGKVFYFDNRGGKETLHAIDARDAKELWQTAVDDVFADAQGPSGPRCTPVVDGEYVYAQSGKGELQCLSVADGHRLWRVNFTNDFGAVFFGEDTPVPGAAEHGFTGAPVVAGPSLIACVGGTNGAGVVCFEKRTGKLVWKALNDRAAYAAPVVARLGGVEQAVCFTVEGLVGLALADGKLLWRVALKTPYGRNCTTPVVVGDWVVAGSYRAGLVGVRVTVDAQGLKAERAWVNKDLAMNFSSPVAVGSYLYGLGPGRQLFCAELQTGRITWSKQGYFTTASETAHGSLIGMGENLLVCTDSGELVLIAADPVACRELGRVRICGPNWCDPAYADGKLYVRDGIKKTGTLYCLDLCP